MGLSNLALQPKSGEFMPGLCTADQAEKNALKAERKLQKSGGRSAAAAELVDAPRFFARHCGITNPVGTFCADCGGKIVKDIFLPGLRRKWSTEKKMKFCPRCGEEMLRDCAARGQT